MKVRSCKRYLTSQLHPILTRRFAPRTALLVPTTDLVIKINTIQPRKTNVREKAPKVLFNLHSIGPDRKGVVAQYAEAFHQHDINIEHLSSDLKVVNGERVFVVDIDGSDHNGRANIEEFKDKLETIKKDLEVKTAKLKVSNKDPSEE